MEQANDLEQEELHRRQRSKVRRRRSNKIVASQRGDPVGNKVRGQARQGRIRHRVRINAHGSARRHRWAQVNVSSAEEARDLG